MLVGAQRFDICLVCVSPRFLIEDAAHQFWEGSRMAQVGGKSRVRELREVAEMSGYVWKAAVSWSAQLTGGRRTWVGLQSR